jgi:hypothetical protein
MRVAIPSLHQYAFMAWCSKIYLYHLGVCKCLFRSSVKGQSYALLTSFRSNIEAPITSAYQSSSTGEIIILFFELTIVAKFIYEM